MTNLIVLNLCDVRDTKETETDREEKEDHIKR